MTNAKTNSVEDEISQKLRILAVLASPVTCTKPLNVRLEWNDLANAVQQSNAPIALIRHQPATLKTLSDAFSPFDFYTNPGCFPHVLYFSGHYLEDSLLLEDDFGCNAPATCDKLLDALRDIYEPLQLCVFNVDQNADLMKSFAESLIDNGICKSVLVLDNTAKTSHVEPINIVVSLWRKLARNDSSIENVINRIKSSHVCCKLFGNVDTSIATLPPSKPQTFDGWPLDALHIPSSASFFFGRGDELVKLSKSLAEAGRVTVIFGAPGIGKSALALEAAHRNSWRFPGGIGYVKGPLTQAEARSGTNILLGKLAEALNVVRDPHGDVTTMLIRRCDEKPTLLILDNLDELLVSHSETQQLVNFLDRIPATHTLITSRSNQNRLKLRSNPSKLSLTKGLDQLAATQCIKWLAKETSGVELRDNNTAYRVARATHGHPALIIVALGIAKDKGATILLDQLKHLSGDFGKKIEDLIGKSVGLLNTHGRRTLATLCLFPAGSCVADAISAAMPEVNVENGLQELISAGLINFERERYTWHPVVMDYARNHTKLDNTDAANARQTTYYRQFLQSHPADQDYILIERELTNIFYVLRNAAQSNDKQVLLDMVEIAYQLSHIVLRRGPWTYDLPWLEKAINVCRESSDKCQQYQLGKLLYDLGGVYQAQSEYGIAYQCYKNSLEINKEEENQFGVSRSLHGLGRWYHDQCDYDKALHYYDESMSIRKVMPDDEKGVATMLHEKGRLAHEQSRYNESRSLYENSLEIREELLEKWGIADTQYELGNLAQEQGHYIEAKERYMQCEKLRLKLNDRQGIATILHARASLEHAFGNFDKANELYKKSLSLQESLGDLRGKAATLCQLGRLARMEHDYNKAKDLLDESLKIKLRNHDQRGEAETLYELGMLQQSQRNYDPAEKYYKKSLNIAKKLKYQRCEANTLRELGRVAERRGFYSNAYAFYRQSFKISEESENCYDLAMTKMMLGRILTGHFNKGLQMLHEAANTLEDIGVWEAPRAQALYLEAGEI